MTWSLLLSKGVRASNAIVHSAAAEVYRSNGHGMHTTHHIPGIGALAPIPEIPAPVIPVTGAHLQRLMDAAALPGDIFTSVLDIHDRDRHITARLGHGVHTQRLSMASAGPLSCHNSLFLHPLSGCPTVASGAPVIPALGIETSGLLSPNIRDTAVTAAAAGLRRIHSGDPIFDSYSGSNSAGSGAFRNPGQTYSSSLSLVSRSHPSSSSTCIVTQQDDELESRRMLTQSQFVSVGDALSRIQSHYTKWSAHCPDLTIKAIKGGTTDLVCGSTLEFEHNKSGGQTQSAFWHFQRDHIQKQRASSLPPLNSTALKERWLSMNSDDQAPFIAKSIQQKQTLKTARENQDSSRGDRVASCTLRIRLKRRTTSVPHMVDADVHVPGPAHYWQILDQKSEWSHCPTCVLNTFQRPTRRKVLRMDPELQRMVQNQGSITGPQLQNHLKHSHGCRTLGKRSVSRLLRELKEGHSLTVPDEPQDMDYRSLSRFCFLFERQNPGSIAKVEADEEDRFVKMLVVFRAQVLRCVRGKKRVFAADGAFFKPRSNVQGDLITLLGFDGENHLVPCVFALVPKEKQEAYDWVFDNLAQIELDEVGVTFGDYLDSADTALFSDRLKGLWNAVHAHFPSARHLPDTWHLLQNIHDYKDKTFPEEMFTKMRLCATRSEFERIMEESAASHPIAVTYLKSLNKLGLKWKDVGPEKPQDAGTELDNVDLTQRLITGQRIFTPQEWDDFKICSVAMSDVIWAGDRYFQPDNEYDNQYLWSLWQYADAKIVTYGLVGSSGAESSNNRYLPERGMPPLPCFLSLCQRVSEDLGAAKEHGAKLQCNKQELTNAALKALTPHKVASRHGMHVRTTSDRNVLIVDTKCQRHGSISTVRVQCPDWIPSASDAAHGGEHSNEEEWVGGKCDCAVPQVHGLACSHCIAVSDFTFTHGATARMSAVNSYTSSEQLVHDYLHDCWLTETFVHSVRDLHVSTPLISEINDLQHMPDTSHLESVLPPVRSTVVHRGRPSFKRKTRQQRGRSTATRRNVLGYQDIVSSTVTEETATHAKTAKRQKRHHPRGPIAGPTPSPSTSVPSDHDALDSQHEAMLRNVGDYTEIDSYCAVQYPSDSMLKRGKHVTLCDSWMKRQHLAHKFSTGWAVGKIVGKKRTRQGCDNESHVEWWVKYKGVSGPSQEYSHSLAKEDYSQAWLFVEKRREASSVSDT